MLAEAHDLVEDALGDFPLGGFGNFDHFVAGDDGDGVAVGIEADAFARNVVDDDGVEILRNQLLAGILQNVLGFGGEADDDLRLPSSAKALSGCRESASSSSVIGPLRLIFWPAADFRAIVGDGSGLDDDGGLREQIQDSIAHFFGRFDPRDFRRPGRRERCRSADQQHACTAAQGSFGQGVAHATAGAIGEIAHGIDLFASGAGGDQHGFARKILRCAESFQHGGDDGFILCQASRAGHAAGQISRAGFDDLHAALAQNLQIRLRRRMIPHVDVHRRSDDDGRGGREIERGQEIAGNALREVRENVGGGGSDDQRIDRLRDRDVLDGGVDIRLCSSPGENMPVMTFSPESAAKVRGERIPGRRGS